MKFRNGHWLMREGVTPLYAVEFFSWQKIGDHVRMIVPCKHQTGRDGRECAALEVEIHSPAAGVIGVTARHFRGRAISRPNFGIPRGGAALTISEDGDFLTLASGSLSVRVHKGAEDWGLDFLSGGRRLTGTGFRSLACMEDARAQKRYMAEQLDLDVGEIVYGLGERFGAMARNGQRVDMWNADGGSCSDLAYKNIPFYLTNRGYGVLVDDPGDASFEVASENVERVGFSVENEELTYFVFDGPTPKDALNRYTDLTGRPGMLPKWAFGLWLSTSFTTDYDEKTAAAMIGGMRDRDIPLSVFHFDPYWMKSFEWVSLDWDRDAFPDAKAMLGRYAEKGLKICCWVNPYVAQFSPMFDEGAEKGYFIKTLDGRPWQTDLWQPGMAVVDFTNPEAYAWFAGKIGALIDMGVSAIKTDFGERIPVRGIRYYDGSDPVRMHNYYTYLYNKCVYEAIEGRHGPHQAALFARSATVGSQKFPLHWGGDNFATYASMAETLRAGLSLSACGFGFWSHDISGFENTAPAHVYKRWCAFGLLSSNSRLHGSKSYRVPWLFDEESCDVLRKFTRLKCSLMPYIYRMAQVAHETGAPVLRPMYMEFPGDPACEYLDRQYMLGESLLVAPVFREDGDVTYYLPRGAWTHLLDGRVQEGGRWITETYDFMSLPLWVRENTALPVGGREDTPEYDYARDLTLRLYEIADGADISVQIPGDGDKTAMTLRVRRLGGKISVTGGETKAAVISGEGTL